MRKITPIDNRGSIQLRFSVSGKRYGLNPVPGGSYSNKKDLEVAKAIALRIETDILTGKFDPSLDSYRLVQKAVPEIAKPAHLLDLFDQWVATLNLNPETYANHYKGFRSVLLKANPKITDTTWLAKADIKPSTYQVRLWMARRCLNWAVEQGLVTVNPYAAMKAPKAEKKRIQPFTKAEMRAILAAFEDRSPHYVPLVKFLFATGVRISEAIGLRWKDVDLYAGYITIAESLPIKRSGNGHTRQRKKTKTGSIRLLTLHDSLRYALGVPGKPEDLVFTSVEGKVISGHNWRERYWQPILGYAGVAYRPVHNTRHTFASHCLEAGMPVTQVAYLLGHSNATMVIKTYGHLINRHELPDLGL
ncbi:site-specific integrase [Leptolyngbya sp. FACHB-17]|uniref:site-specific integrase n=1 Tax=unclassified Leptolyngbya TaxID=2650499 RepID=UPI00168141DB|nr:site-specific integrase [Leptolyngbya sp. FACHB-17]MBD2079322.1 site-specific integrase [Leptolyngbya sp. FACHB-17]